MWDSFCVNGLAYPRISYIVFLNIAEYELKILKKWKCSKIFLGNIFSIAADLPPGHFTISILGNMKKEHPETDVEKNLKMLLKHI